MNNWTQVPSPVPYCKAFMRGASRVFVGEEPGVGWHLSISCADRYPDYEEIKAARYDLVPHDVTMAMLFPPLTQFVNIHNNCFHLFQIPNRE